MVVVGAGGVLLKMALHTERRELFGDSHVDELAERDALALYNLARYLKKRRLKPKHEIALSRLRFSTRFTLHRITARLNSNL